MAITTRLHSLRRRITTTAVHAGLSAGGCLSPHHAFGLGLLAGRAARLPLRRRLARHMRLAGIEPSSQQLDSYFELLGRWFGQAMALYRRGYANSGIDEQIIFGESAANLRTALELGRGAIVAEWHYHCHEIALAAIAQQFPLAVIVRESKDPAHAAVKMRWYEACGVETVTRSRQALGYRTVLRDNKVLVVSPDALGPRGEGVPVELLGRRVELPPGLVALAMITGAPVVFTWPEWRGDQLVVQFDEPLTFSKRGDRDATLRDGMQEWARRLEICLRRQPEVWMHWLDKQWSRVWRGER